MKDKVLYLTFDSLLDVNDRDSATDVEIKVSERVRFEGSVAVKVAGMPEIEWLETRMRMRQIVHNVGKFCGN